MSSRKTIFRFVALAALPIWAIGMTTVVACLMVSHWVPLPHPASGQILTGHETLTAPSQAGEPGWSAVHFLYADCPCSRRILERLLTRSPSGEVPEQIVLIGRQNPQAQIAASKGYHVCFVTAAELKSRFGIESAPLLIVADPTGIIRYAGGYTSRKQGPDIQDETLIQNAVAGRWQKSLPLYGCAVSRQLKDLVDPLQLK